MTFEVRSEIPGLDPEAKRALVEVQTAIKRECKRLEDQIARPKRRVTELVEEGAVIAKPGEVVRVQPGDEDVTVVLPEPSAASDGQDIVISFEGDGTAAGRVLVKPASGTCAFPGTQTLNAPGTYRYTSTGGGAAPKAPSNAVPLDTSTPSGGGWGGPAPIVAEDLPDDAVDNDVLANMPGNSVKVNATGATASPTDLVIAADSVLGRLGGNLGSVALADIDSASIVYDSASHTFQRAALTGAITASQNSNATLFDTNASGAGLTGGGTAVLAVGAGNRITVNANDVAWAGLPIFDTGVLAGDATAILEFTAGSPLDIAASDLGAGVVRVTYSLSDGDRGDITVSGSGATWTVNNDAITDAKLRNSAALSVIGRAANSTGDPADIVAANDAEVLRRSGTTLGFGTLSLAAFPSIADDTFLANISGGAAQPTAVALTTLAGAGLTGGADAVLAVGAGTRITVNANDVQLAAGAAESFFGNFTSGSAVADYRAGSSVAGGGLSYAAGGTLAVGAGTRITVNADDVQLAAGAAESFLGNFTAGSGVADYRAGSSVAGGGLTYTAGGTLAVGAGNRITVNANDVAWAGLPIFDTGVSVGDASAILEFTAGSPLDIAASDLGGGVVRVTYSLSDGDRGDITVSSSGTVWTIDNDAVSDAKLRNSGALSVIGRSANSSGDPADISAVAASGGVLRESGSAIGFGQIALAGLPSIADDTFLANIAGSTTTPTAVALTTLAGAGLTGGADAVLAVGAGTRITVNANDVQLAAGAAESFLGNFTAGSAVADYRAGSSVAGAGLTYTAGGTLAVGAGNRITANANDVAWAGLPIFDTGVLAGDASAILEFTATSPLDIAASDLGGGVVRVTYSLADGDRGDITVSSATWTIDNNAVSDAKLRDSAALSVIGRSANSTGDPADIAAGTDGFVLRRSGTTLGFGEVATAGIADNAVTDDKLRNSAALSVIGRSANSTGDPADIAAGTDGHVLRRSGTTLGFGTIATAGIADNAVTNTELANMTEGTIKGRASGAGTGDPTDLTGTQVVEIIDSPLEANPMTWSAEQTFAGAVRLDGVINATISGDTNNWNPTGLSTCNVIRLSSSGLDATWDITGMDAQSGGRVIRVIRVDGPDTPMPTFIHQSGSSTAANRFICPSNVDFTLPVGSSVTWWYDDTTDRWRIIATGRA